MGWSPWRHFDRSTLGDQSGANSERMMPRDVFLTETQEPRGVVVEDVALLLFGQQGRLVDNGDRALDRSRPDHLIRSEHDAVGEPGVDDRLQVAIKRRPRLRIDDDPDVDVYLRVRV